MPELILVAFGQTICVGSFDECFVRAIEIGAQVFDIIELRTGKKVDLTAPKDVE